jgi:hypothetical protein
MDDRIVIAREALPEARPLLLFSLVKTRSL